MAAARILYSVASAEAPNAGVARRIGAAAGPWDIAVLNGHGRRFRTRSAGAFSLKWMAEGRARYLLERHPHAVSRSAAVLVDQDQPYEMEFEARRESQSFCLFYAPGLVAEAWSSLEAGCSPDTDGTAAPGFPNVVFPPSARLSALLSSLHAEGPQACADRLETRLLLALGEAVETARRHRGLTGRMPAVKAATRAHVLGLLEQAREAIVAVEGVGVRLDTLSADVGLSRFHFLRLFKTAYGKSPLAFAEQQRMAAAARRLRTGPALVIQLAADLGYDSPSAFARAFRRHNGAAPAEFRRAARN
jgi:AraC family transcriptional regulator